MARRRITVAVGLLGTTLDRGSKGPGRWETWRPTVALFQHEDLLIDRFEMLLTSPRFEALADAVEADIASVSPETTVRRHVVPMADPWDFEEVYGALLDLTRRLTLDPEREDLLVHITTGSHVAQICLFLLAETRELPGRLVQTSPPRRKSDGGPGSYQVIDLDLSRYDRIAARFQRRQREDLSALKSGIETRNRAFNRLIERLETVAVSSTAPILLLGPTGAGKSRLARRIHELKKARRRLDGPFVDVNCATLRGDGAMSALFGHEKGAFTGAAEKRTGLLRTAHGGLLFLDEIGELGPDEQAMLLRAVEEKRFLPLGSDKEATSDFQLVAGTNRDLAEDARKGRFREDLLARIDLWTFRLPPLRERPEDLEPNLEHELEAFADRNGARVRLVPAARERFLAFARSPEALWSANFRDLNAAVTRMATLAAGGRVTTDGVEEEIERLRAAWHRPASAGGDAQLLTDVLGPDGAARLDRFDAVQLADVIRVCRGARSLSEAGRTLFAASRAKKASVNDADRLRKYLARFGLDWEAASARA